jgi:flavodoxin
MILLYHYFAGSKNFLQEVKMQTKRGTSAYITGNESVDNGFHTPILAKKILVAFFSHSGNTRIIAEQIKNITKGDIFEIEPVKEYPSAYQSVVDQAKREINANYKPELKTKIENLDNYNVFFIGSPNWWSTIAPPVASFLSGYDFEGKTIIPFITHEGSRLGHCVSDIKKLCPTASVVDEHPFRGSSVRQVQNEISEWLQKI